jgi:hypothetical protein
MPDQAALALLRLQFAFPLCGIVSASLQALQKLKQLIGRFEPAWDCIDRPHLGQSRFLEG